MSTFIIISEVNIVNAYQYYDYGWTSQNYSIDIGESRYDYIWTDQFKASVDYWNATNSSHNTGVNIVIDTNFDKKVF